MLPPALAQDSSSPRLLLLLLFLTSGALFYTWEECGAGGGGALPSLPAPPAVHVGAPSSLQQLRASPSRVEVPPPACPTSSPCTAPAACPPAPPAPPCATCAASSPCVAPAAAPPALPHERSPALPAPGSGLFLPCGPVEVPPPPPLRTDLVLKSKKGNDAMLSHMTRGLRLLWPGSQLVLVLDGPGDVAWVWALVSGGAVLPSVRWVVDPVPGADSYFGQMHSNLWADAYTTAPFVAIMDTDLVMQFRADRGSLTHANKLVLRYFACPNYVPPPGAGPGGNVVPPRPSVVPLPEGVAKPPDDNLGCLYEKLVTKLLQLPYVGNFMVSTPLVVPRSLFPALRAHVERVHGKPFNDVMGELRQLEGSESGVHFSQHAALGVFAWHHPEALGLDGGAGVDGVTGLHFVAWGREEMFPHVGDHFYEQKYGRGSPPYDVQAAALTLHAVCRSYTNVAPGVCPAELPPRMQEVVTWQGWGPGLGHIRAEKYVNATRRTCFAPA